MLDMELRSVSIITRSMPYWKINRCISIAHTLDLLVKKIRLCMSGSLDCMVELKYNSGTVPIFRL